MVKDVNELIDVSIGVFELNDSQVPDLVRLPMGTPFPVELPWGAKITDVHLGIDTLPDPKNIGHWVAVGQSGRILYTYFTANSKDKQTRLFVLVPSTQKVSIPNTSDLVYLGSFPIPRSVDFMILFELINY